MIRTGFEASPSTASNAHTTSSEASENRNVLSDFPYFAGNMATSSWATLVLE